MRRQREQEMNEVLENIVNMNTSFEDFFSKNQKIGKHQTIISTIPAEVNFPAPKTPTIPPPVTGRFNIPEEDKKVDTIKKPIAIAEEKQKNQNCNTAITSPKNIQIIVEREEPESKKKKVIYIKIYLS